MRSKKIPPLIVWFLHTLVKLSDIAKIIPEECEGYGPPAMLEKVGMLAVGILFSDAFCPGRM
jgi:hypothetical protein